MKSFEEGRQQGRRDGNIAGTNYHSGTSQEEATREYQKTLAEHAQKAAEEGANYFYGYKMGWQSGILLADGIRPKYIQPTIWELQRKYK